MRPVKVAAMLGLGLFAGCGEPSALMSSTVFVNDAAVVFDAPERVVVGVTVGDGGDPNGNGTGTSGTVFGGSASNLPRCAKDDQPNCCYANDDPKAVHGTPNCAWRGLAPGESIQITNATAELPGGKTQPAVLPAPIELVNASPAQFKTYEECLKKPFGFVLRGPGLDDDQYVSSTIQHFAISRGIWEYQGGGATGGLVAAQDTKRDPSRDAGAPPTPTYTGSQGLCNPNQPAPSTITAYIAYTDTLYSFKMQGVTYTVNLRDNPNGSIKGVYAVIPKAF